MWGAVWACYQFRYSPTPVPDRHFALTDILRTQARGDWIAAHGGLTPPPGDIDDLVRQWHPKLTTRLILAGIDHHFLPEAFLVGILHLSGQSETRVMFLNGSNSYLGWWYYFPLTFLYKTPLTVLVTIVLAVVVCIVRRWRLEESHQWAFAVVLTAGGIYLLAAVRSDVNVGIRHLMPVYPFLYILLGAAAGLIWQFSKSSKVILPLLAIGLAVETFTCFPDFIPFLNVAVGGWRQGVNLLGDSNIDLGEDLPALAQWQRENPDRQLYLSYFGTADPRYYGIHYVNLPGSMAQPDQDRPNGLPAVVAVSAAMLRNPLLSSAQQTLFKFLQGRQPMVVLGHTIYVYEIR
jgi:hypothetical protein